MIEVLAALAVIAILSTLLFVGMGHTRKLAGSTKCQQHLRQLAVGFLLYTQDHAQVLPILQAPGDNENWQNAIAPYLGGEDLVPVYYGHNLDEFYCPAFEEACGGLNVRVANGSPSSYAGNARLLPLMNLPNQSTVYLSAVPEPADTLLLCEGIPYPAGRAGVFTLAQLHSEENGGFVGYWHQDRANFLFVDGHVESLREDEVEDRNYSDSNGRLY